MPDPQMDDLLNQSNKVQADRYAANPVSANTATPPPEPNQKIGVPQAGFLAAPDVKLGGPFGLAFGDGAKTPPAAASVVQSATVPRPPVDMTNTARNGPNTYQNADSQAVAAGVPNARGPIETAVQGGLPSGITGVRGNYSGVGAPSDLPPTPLATPTSPAGLVSNAANRQNSYDQAGFVEQRAREDAARPGYAETQQAQSAARVANFLAKNGQVSGLQRGRNLTEGKAAFAADAAQANKRVSDIEAAARAPGVQPPKTNFVQQAQEANEATNKDALSRSLAARTAAEGAESKSRIALTAEELKQKKQITDMTAAIGQAKTPEERAARGRDILAVLGKDPKRFSIQHAAGESGTDPNTGMAFKKPDQILLIDSDTGNVVDLSKNPSGNAPEPAKQNFVKGQGGKAADGSRVVWDGTQWKKA